MRPVKIITDSCSDLSKDLRDKYDIDYVHMNTVYEGKETPASLDWEYYSPKELYDIMRAGNRVLTTQVPQAEFDKVFTAYVEKGYDIVYIACSVKQTNSVNTGALVSMKIMEKYPAATICCVDSYNSSMGEGLLAIRAAELRDKGLDPQQIEKELIKVRKTINEFATVNTLDFLKKAGRVKASAAFFGNLLGVKPILIQEKNGYQTAIKKVKGRSNSLNELVSLLKEAIIDAENQTIYVVHADCNPDEVKEFEETIKRELKCKDVHISYMGPIIGASCGPETVGIWGWGKEVTYEVQ